MSSVTLARRSRSWLERLFDALLDPARSDVVMASLLAGYALVRSAYAAIAHSSQDTHFDMGEMYAWSHEVGLSTPTHPPLGAWLVRAWFSILPAQPWAFYMLGVVLATVALWIVWRIAGRYLTAEKRVLAIALLTFIPFYNFHAFKFNANVVQTPFWAMTTWCFIQSFATRRSGWSLLAGVGAGLSMLGKYWSIFLLGGLACAALTDPRRRAYFRSPAPWLTIASGIVVLAPHLIWISTHGFPTLHFAVTSHATSFVDAAISAAGFLAGTLGYAVLPIALALLATHRSAGTVADTLWPADPERRFLVVAFAAPLLLGALAALVMRAEIVSLWSMAAMTLFPVVLLSSPRAIVNRTAATGVLALAIALPLVALAISPAIAIVIHRDGLSDYQSQYSLIARAVQNAWQARTTAPLRIVGSYRNIADGTAFYFPSRPRTYAITDPRRTPWVNDAMIKPDGIALVCPVPETSCVRKMNAYARQYGARVEDVTLSRRFFGTSDTPVHYQIVIIPPQ
jgi:4-amino-4-deoxy-L-arabinose transferase-like glycosyltransferase